jgi:glycosyltransferase 2 family protein
VFFKKLIKFLGFMKRKLINLAKILLIAIVLFFLIRFFVLNIGELKQIDFKFDLPKFLIAMLLFVIYKFNQSLLWHYITFKNKCNISLNKSIISWFYSLLGRYVPGKILLLGGRLYFYHKERISKRKITLCFLIENICTVLAGAFLFLISLLFVDNPNLNPYKLPVIIMIGIFFIIIHPKIIGSIFNFLLRIFKRKQIILEIKYVDVLSFLFIFTINFLIAGIGFYVLANSIYPIEIKYIFYVAGTFGLSAVIGIISFFAPSGIGVREGIMVLALKYIIPKAAAGVVSILARFWTTLTELLLVGIVFLYAKIKKVEFKYDDARRLAKNNENDINSEA